MTAVNMSGVILVTCDGKQCQNIINESKSKLKGVTSTFIVSFKPGESPLMTASPTLPQSIDTHVEEDPTSSGSMDKSPCENYSARDIRIKKLEDENTELHIRCQQAESKNTKLVLHASI
ncbi:MAG: hypothetical protein WBZ36_22690 [Candidatus Nitrosopolaris sp.]